MAAPVLANRSVAFVNKVGTDDPGYNAVGKPDSFLTIAAALADLAANYPTASLTNPHVVAVGPGVFVTAAFALPPFTFIEGSADDESGTTSILSMTGNITLGSTWSVNATKNGGFANLVIRAESGTPVIDLTVPTPAAGNPTRTVELENIRTDLDRVDFEATSTADRLNVQRFVHDGSNANDIEFSGGTQSINNLQSGAIVTLNDTTGVGNSCQAYGIFITNASSSLRCISTGASATTIRLGACDNRNLFLSETAPGVITVFADAVSIPLMANVTFGGTATNADLIRTTDAGGFAGGITGPGSSTLNAFVIWDNTLGTLVRNSDATLSTIAANTVTLNVPAADLLLAAILGTGATFRLGRGANGDITETPSGTGSFRVNNATKSAYINENVGNFQALYLGLPTATAITITNYAMIADFNGNSGTQINCRGSASFITLNVADVPKVKLAGTGNLLLAGLLTDGSGVIQLPAGTTGAGGVTAGTDTQLYRQSAAAWAIDAPSALGMRLNWREQANTVFEAATASGVMTMRTTTAATFNLGYNSTNVISITSTTNATFAGTITKPGGTTPLITTNTAVTDGAGVGVGTLTNAPASTNPTKWMPINDNGTTRYFPTW